MFKGLSNLKVVERLIVRLSSISFTKMSSVWAELLLLERQKHKHYKKLLSLYLLLGEPA